jgi:hypothetical protein
MPLLPDLSYYGRMTRGVRELLRQPVPADPAGSLRAQLERREASFLETVQRVIFADPAHPYHQMLRLAGCECGDLAAAVERDGLEPALEKLRAAGVYLSHDEFKGKRPIVRGDRSLPGGPERFRNPLARGSLESRSSGSRSAGTATPKSASHRAHTEAYQLLFDREFRLDQRCQIVVKPILPAADGLTGSLRCLRAGNTLAGWYSPAGAGPDSGHYRLATHSLVLLARLHGYPLPFPVYLPPNDFSPVAGHIARLSGCAVRTHVSPAVRIAAAALDHGLDIRGTLFFTGGEALTDAKRAVIESAGARAYPRYAISEIGPIGYSCPQMTTGNSVHLFQDSVTAIVHRRPAPLSEAEVDSLLFTTLLPSSPHVLINAEMDDSGVLEPARCDCVFSRLGFTTRVRDIFSFGKLTGQGMTLVGSDVVRILEEVLPRRFGGHPGDYQLVELDGQSQTRLIFRVSPRVPLESPERLKECFLGELRRLTGGAVASRVWKHTEALEVVRAEPYVSGRGKVLALHLMRSGHAT